MDTNNWVLNLSTNPPDLYNGTISEHQHNAMQSPYPNIFWFVNQAGDDVIHPNMTVYHTPAFTEPFPWIYWNVNSQGNDVIHAGELPYPTYALRQPYPYIFWFTNGSQDDVIHYAFRVEERMGACHGGTNIAQMFIPSSVKRIGSYMANDTQLTSVTIASDCVYDTTSFPAGCTVNFYPTQ